MIPRKQPFERGGMADLAIRQGQVLGIAPRRFESIFSGAPFLLALVFRQQGPYIVGDFVVY